MVKHSKACEAWWKMVKHGEALRIMVNHGEAWWSMVKNGEALWSMVKNGEALWIMVKHGEAWWSVVKHGEALWNMVKYYEAWWHMVKHLSVLCHTQTQTFHTLQWCTYMTTQQWYAAAGWLRIILSDESCIVHIENIDETNIHTVQWLGVETSKHT